jgi:hypothetical protein
VLVQLSCPFHSFSHAVLIYLLISVSKVDVQGAYSVGVVCFAARFGFGISGTSFGPGNRTLPLPSFSFKIVIFICLEMLFVHSSILCASFGSFARSSVQASNHSHTPPLDDLFLVFLFYVGFMRLFGCTRCESREFFPSPLRFASLASFQRFARSRVRRLLV